MPIQLESGWYDQSAAKIVITDGVCQLEKELKRLIDLLDGSDGTGVVPSLIYSDESSKTSLTRAISVSQSSPVCSSALATACSGSQHGRLDHGITAILYPKDIGDVFKLWAVVKDRQKSAKERKGKKDELENALKAMEKIEVDIKVAAQDAERQKKAFQERVSQVLLALTQSFTVEETVKDLIHAAESTDGNLSLPRSTEQRLTEEILYSALGDDSMVASVRHVVRCIRDQLVNCIDAITKATALIFADR